jgi:hypothetical protein
MKLDIPEPQAIFPRMMNVESSFMGRRQTIREWVMEHRREIEANLDLVRNPSDAHDIEILLSFLRNLLVRAMRGEAGERTYLEFGTRRVGFAAVTCSARILGRAASGFPKALPFPQCRRLSLKGLIRPQLSPICSFCHSLDPAHFIFGCSCQRGSHGLQ